MRKAIIYYSNNNLPKAIQYACIAYLELADLPIFSVTHRPVRLGTNICVGQLPYCHDSIYHQIQVGIEASKADTVYLAEHDVLYPPGYFEPEPESDYLYIGNVYCLDKRGFSRAPHQKMLSGLVAKANVLYSFCEKQKGQKIVWAEPELETTNLYIKGLPHIDIRHGKNFTGGRNEPVLNEEIPYWGKAHGLQHLFRET